MLSPACAAVFTEYDTTITFEFSSPESIVANSAKDPARFHCQPVAAAVVAVAAGSAGAMYLYFLAPQLF